MNIYLSALALILFLLCKMLVWSREEGKERLVRFLEFPVDANLVGFLGGIAALSSDSSKNENASWATILAIILMITSISIWKYSSSLIIDKGISATVIAPLKLAAFTLLNLIISLLAIMLPVYAMGINLK